MPRPFPIHVESATCRDCYKCVRHCPMKAVEIRNHTAQLLSDRCIACGTCVTVCPSRAKRVRDDVGTVRRLLEKKEKVIVSLAPSAVSAFDAHPNQLIRGLKRLGFFGVSETAVGAEAVSYATYRRLTAPDRGARFDMMISSACPAAVALIQRRFHALGDRIALMDSPMLAHGKLLRKRYGQNIGVVFIGPCIAKKCEADEAGDIIDAALTFEELGGWLEREDIDLSKQSSAPDERFLLGDATDGMLYPMEGGMIESILAFGPVDDVTFMSFSGIDAILTALNADDIKEIEGLFLELLCCEGGCINGPKVGALPQATVLNRLKVGRARRTRPTTVSEERRRALSAVDLTLSRAPLSVSEESVSQERIREALLLIGKKHIDDELNCGGCGYDSCRDLARALVLGHAEKEMCVSHMRRLAMNKASALMAAMPSGLAILDNALHIVECNRRFAEILGGDVCTVYDTLSGLGGAHISKVFPVSGIYDDFLASSESFFEKELCFEDKILKISLFDIEGKEIVGSIIQDITSPAGRRHQIVRNAEEAIRRNLATAQQIACLLGENAAETEVLLNAIVRSFSMERDDA